VPAPTHGVPRALASALIKTLSDDTLAQRVREAAVSGKEPEKQPRAKKDE
jgi:hypothetical protein